MFLDLITIATFLLVCFVFFLVGDAIAAGNRAGRKKELNRGEGSGGSTYSASHVGAFKRAMAGVIPQSDQEIKKIELDLKRAGYYRSTALVEYLATRNILIVMVLIGTGIGCVLADPGTNYPEIILVAGLLVAGSGYGLPRMVLHNQASRRVNRIQKGLPDALDLVMMCLTGGVPLRTALKRVTEEVRFSHPDIAVEFDIIRRHADANSMADALKQFARRIDAPDVNTLSLMISQTERLGTNVSTALIDFADGIRRKYRQRAEEHSSKTSIKLLFPVIFCMAPPIYILFFAPAVLELRNFLIREHRPGGILEPSTYGETISATSESVLEQNSTGGNQ
ncbi:MULTISPECIES: type II secretion system F family protein [Gimesia]|uniref:Type II secretion system F family protein n=1 Tax=Gimesia benthica TaxID=2608982 RepID=A0A6I6A6K0_9PLAN|nr:MULTISPECIES: type II secretion system F family protein [Gimesia]KAA0131844.1 type II secretion system F family protein [Gimesia chilikensis]QGQ21713.1 type II secretion system F family protein [Gimesia benthica]